MARPEEILDAVEKSLKSSNRLPSGISYLKQKPNVSDNADLSVPFVAMWFPSTIRSDPHNTKFRDFAKDEEGNHIGYIFESYFESRLQIEVWSVNGDGIDPASVGTSIYLALAKHDSKQYGLPFLDENDDAFDAFRHYLQEEEEEFIDDTFDPVVNGWRMEAFAGFRDRINTAEEYGAVDYVAKVDGPTSGDFESEPEDSLIEYKKQ